MFGSLAPKSQLPAPLFLSHARAQRCQLSPRLNQHRQRAKREHLWLPRTFQGALRAWCRRAPSPSGRIRSSGQDCAVPALKAIRLIEGRLVARHPKRTPFLDWQHARKKQAASERAIR